jgi:hypothetical protein
MFEYRAEHEPFDIANVVKRCNEMAQDGWRLVTALEDEQRLEKGVWLIFERPARQAV